MRWKQPNWTRILTILLVILASYAVLYILASILLRFTQAILLLVLGAIVAYILTPLVNRLERAFRFRWVGILLAYCMVAVALFSLSLMLFTPFIQQAQSLVDNLHNPSRASLRTIVQVENDTHALRQKLKTQDSVLTAGNSLTDAQVKTIANDVARIRRDLVDLQNGTISGKSHTARVPGQQVPGRLPPNPQPQTQVPTSYVDTIRIHVNAFASQYNQATADVNQVDRNLFKSSMTDAKQAAAAARNIDHIMSTTPIVVLRSQTWLDQHNLRVDVHDKFGQAAQQISNQGSDILDNAITILSATANILLNFTLILIIAFYLLNDSPRLMRQGLRLVPVTYRDQVWFFVTSLDKVLGGYIRGQLFLSILAGILGGGGAAVLGVPYPLLIGIVTFLLESIPVIGPMVAVVPAVAISLFFMPFVTTVILTVWFLVFQQIVTNVLGPRIMGMAVGIHPLEALLAVLVGYPLGGFLGAFLAVPVAGILHILIREAYAYFVLGHAAPAAPPPLEPEPEEETVLAAGTGSHPQSDRAASQASRL